MYSIQTMQACIHYSVWKKKSQNLSQWTGTKTFLKAWESSVVINVVDETKRTGANYSSIKH